MKEILIDKVLSEQKFSEKEKEAFRRMLSYAKATMDSSSDNLKPYMIDQINKIANDIQ